MKDVWLRFSQWRGATLLRRVVVSVAAGTMLALAGISLMGVLVVTATQAALPQASGTATASAAVPSPAKGAKKTNSTKAAKATPAEEEDE